ncbi:hypothetical protein HDV63DRAFT_248333 [Trichoderma sp. SZMC 28014]
MPSRAIWSPPRRHHRALSCAFAPMASSVGVPSRRIVWGAWRESLARHRRRKLNVWVFDGCGLVPGGRCGSGVGCQACQTTLQPSDIKQGRYNHSMVYCRAQEPLDASGQSFLASSKPTLHHLLPGWSRHWSGIFCLVATGLAASSIALRRLLVLARVDIWASTPFASTRQDNARPG